MAVENSKPINEQTSERLAEAVLNMSGLSQEVLTEIAALARLVKGALSQTKVGLLREYVLIDSQALQDAQQGLRSIIDRATVHTATISGEAENVGIYTERTLAMIDRSNAKPC